MSTFELGQRVTFRRPLERVWDHSRKRWTDDPKPHLSGWDWYREARDRERSGVIVGKRTLANGRVHLGSYDEPTTFEAEERFEAYLIAYALRRKPVLVRAEHITAVNS